MCVRDQSYACVYTRELGTPTTSPQNIFDSEKLTSFHVLLTGLEQGHGVRWIVSPIRRSTCQLSHPSTHTAFFAHQ